MGKNFQPNYSLYLQEDTLSKLKFLSQTSGFSMAQIVNKVMADYVSKFSAEIAELKHATQTAAFKIKEKFFGENVKKISIKRLPTNDGARLAAVLDDAIVATVKICAEVDEKTAIDFVNRALATIGNRDYEITCTEKSIVITVEEKTLSQEFEDASTAERVESFIDEVIAQLAKQAFQDQGN